MNKFLFATISLCVFSLATASVHVNYESSSLPDDPQKLYIDLIKKCVANTIYEDPSADPLNPQNYNQQTRENGQDWPLIAHTMVGMKRLDNIQYCIEQVLENNIPGDFIETGVWRGGSTILMRAILKAYDVKDRKVWVADSFEGLPPPNPDLYPEDRDLYLNQYSALAIPLETVQENFKHYGLLDSQVAFLKGFFSQILPEVPIQKLAVLRLDGDLYESTMDALVHLYPKLSPGGYIIIDDYGAIPACAKAVTDYRNRHAITDPIIQIDWTGVFWQKTK